MTFLKHTRRFSKKLQKALPDPVANLPATISEHLEDKSFPILKTVSWGTAAVGVLAVGVIFGRELRLRYKFNRRTPYDFYAHSGDEQDVDFGLGV